MLARSKRELARSKRQELARSIQRVLVLAHSKRELARSMQVHMDHSKHCVRRSEPLAWRKGQPACHMDRKDHSKQELARSKLERKDRSKHYDCQKCQRVHWMKPYRS